MAQPVPKPPHQGDSRSIEPLVGFNTNLCYGGTTYHVQTEDAGVRRAHIDTHVFASDGRIVRSLRFDYSQYRDREQLPSLVRRAMKAQHRALCEQLTSGRLDTLLEAVEDEEPHTSVRPVVRLRQVEANTRGVGEEPRQVAGDAPESLPVAVVEHQTMHPWEAAIASVQADWRELAARDAVEQSPEPSNSPVAFAAPTPPTAAEVYDAGLDSWRAGDKSLALSQWSLAVHLDPDNRIYRASLRRLLGLMD